MGLPVIVNLPADTWVLAKENFNGGDIHKKSYDPSYIWTYRTNGTLAPVSPDEGVHLFDEGNTVRLPTSGLYDLYIMALKEAGKVRIDSLSNAVFETENPNSIKIPLDNYFLQENAIETALADAAVFDANAVRVVDPSSFSIGDTLILTYPGNIYFGQVLLVATDVLTLDSPLPFAFPQGSTAQSFSRELNVDGSITPQVFSVFGSGAENVQINLTRLVMTGLCTDPVDLSKFGDIVGGVVYGLVLRGVPEFGDPSNQWNVKTNRDLDNLTGGDWTPYSSINPAQGQNGFTARYTYGGKDKHDSIPPINKGDRLDLIIQDDLTSILDLLLLYGGNTEIFL